MIDWLIVAIFLLVIAIVLTLRSLRGPRQW
jgi:hypothetical protein